MNNELDNYPANFVHHKAATPPSTNPGSATGAHQTSTSTWPHWVVLKTAFTIQHNADNVSLCQHGFITFSPTPVARALFHLQSSPRSTFVVPEGSFLDYTHILSTRRHCDHCCSDMCSPGDVCPQTYSPSDICSPEQIYLATIASVIYVSQGHCFSMIKV